MRLGIECGEHTEAVAKKHGIQGVGIGLDDLVANGVEKTVAPVHEKGFQVCQIGAFGFNALQDSEEQKSQLQRLIKGLEFAPQTGCRYIVIGVGNYHPSGFFDIDSRNRTTAALEKYAEHLKPAIEAAEKYGSAICIEPYIKGAIYSPEAFLQLKEMVGSDALRINIDVTSLYDLSDMIDPTENKISEYDLINRFGYPDVDLDEIDAEWY